MAVTRSSGTGPAVARPALLRAFLAVVHLIPIVVLIQAVLAGRGQFVDADFLDIHGYLGNLSFLLAVIQAVLVFLVGFTGRARTTLAATSLILLVLMTAQIGMGYAGRDNPDVAAWHLPTGVLIFGLAVANVSLALRAAREG